ncbi:MAG: Peripla 4 protein [Thermodesulfobacteriota bacterium]|nr:Peripla 4 protein [Thermodesulfobacteriota bacterium]
MGRKALLGVCLAFVFALGAILVGTLPAGAKQLEIAVMVPNGVDPYFTAKRYGYETECEKLGVKMLFLDAGGYANVNKQIGQIEDMLQRGVDGIILGATSAQGTVPVVDKVIDKGMPLVIDNLDSLTKKPVLRIMKNGVLVGLLRAVYIVEQLKGKGTVLVLPGPSAVSLCQEEHRGFVEYAKHFPGIKVITEWTPSSPDAGMKTVEGVMQAHPDLKAIACFSPPLSTGAVKAVQASGVKKGDIIIVGQMLDAGMEEYMKNGWLQATVMCDHIEMAREAVRMLVKEIKGELKPPLYNQIDHYLVTEGTLEQFDRKGSTYPKEWRK